MLFRPTLSTAGLRRSSGNQKVVMRGFIVRRDDEGIRRGWDDLPESAFPEGDLKVRVLWSSLNYKDVLAAQGHRGIVKRFPHVPGIDAAGTVISSKEPTFQTGDEVIITGYELGVERWGGWAEQISVPTAWAIPKPAGLSLLEAMTLGTAGFTACQCVEALQNHGVRPQDGPIAVTGASGGVGSLACQLLHQLGYSVTAITGKVEQAVWLLQRGATEVIARDTFVDESDRPLLSAKWAGAVDTLGGAALSTLIRSTKHRGVVAACGLAAASDLPITVYPFILRGVTLAGIDSAWCPAGRRQEIWNKLAGDWKFPGLSTTAKIIRPDELEAAISLISSGANVGRIVLRMAEEP